MKVIESFKKRFHNTALALLWHRYAPPLTVRRRFFGARVFMDFRDSIDYVSRTKTELEHHEWPLMVIPEIVEGTMWDVGANVGLFSVRAALVGRKCIAFELSPKACNLMRRTKLANDLDFEVVNRPLTTIRRLYLPPSTAHLKNAVALAEDSECWSMSFQEAERVYGTPKFIKMDIEGGEKDFFDNHDFKKWLVARSIVWLVEVHSEQLKYTPEWQDIPHKEISPGHVLYCDNPAEVERLTSECRRFAEKLADA
jgi:FkbM family methyltransferase